MTLTVEQLKAQSIPALLAGTADIHDYGSTSVNAQRDERLHALLKDASRAGLTRQIEGILACITSADPAKLVRSHGLFARITGSGLVTQSRYLESQVSLDRRIEVADAAAARLKVTVAEIHETQQSYDSDTAILKTEIQALDEFLAENPRAGIESTGPYDFNNSRERAERRLSNLRVYLLSMQQTNLQLKMVKHHLDLAYDGYIEATTITLPLWRKRMIDLNITDKIQGEALDLAIETHQKLKQSLSENFNAIQ